MTGTLAVAACIRIENLLHSAQHGVLARLWQCDTGLEGWVTPCCCALRVHKTFRAGNNAFVDQLHVVSVALCISDQVCSSSLPVVFHIEHDFKLPVGAAWA